MLPVRNMFMGRFQAAGVGARAACWLFVSVRNIKLLWQGTGDKVSRPGPARRRGTKTRKRGEERQRGRRELNQDGGR